MSLDPAVLDEIYRAAAETRAAEAVEPSLAKAHDSVEQQDDPGELLS